MTKRIKRAGLLALSVLLAALTACAPPTTPNTSPDPAPSTDTAPGERTKVSMLMWWANEQGWDVINGIKAEFEKAYPDVELVIEDMPYNQAHDALVTRNLAGEAPDIIVAQAAWLVEFAESGIIAPIDDLIAAASPEVQAYLDTPMATTWKGQRYGVPTAQNGLAMYYNKKLLAEVGMDYPKTWDDVRALAKEMRKIGKYALTGNLAAEPPSQISFEVWPLILQAGGKILENGQPAFNTPEGVKALEYLKELYDNEGMTPGALTALETQKRENFVAENTALMYESPSGINIIAKGNPDMEYGVAPLPKGVASGTIMQGTQFTISQQSAVRDQAWKFLEWVNSPAGSEFWAKSLNFMPANADAQKSAFVQDNPVLAAFIDAYNSADRIEFPDPQMPNSTEMRKAMTVEVHRFLEGEKSAQQALDDAAKAWADEIAKVG